MGEASLKHHGKKKWKGYVNDVVERLLAALEPDYIVIGGGDADKLGPLPKKSRLGDNGDASSAASDFGTIVRQRTTLSITKAH